MERAKDISESSPVDAFARYKRKNFKGIVTEIIEDAFEAEHNKQIRAIRAETQKAINALPIPPVPHETPNWFQRNRNSLIIAGIALLAVISLVLILTGVLAPLGIGIAAGTATTVAIAGASGAGAIAVAAGVNVVKNEIQISNQPQAYQKQKQIYDKSLEDLNDTKNQKLEELEASTKKNLANFLKEKVESIDETTLLAYDIATMLEDAPGVTNELENPLLLEGESLLQQAKLQIDVGEKAVKESKQVVVRVPIIAPSKDKVVSEETLSDEAQQTFKNTNP
jgi:hypothetical protein